MQPCSHTRVLEASEISGQGPTPKEIVALLRLQPSQTVSQNKASAVTTVQKQSLAQPGPAFSKSHKTVCVPATLSVAEALHLHFELAVCLV